MRWRQLSDSDTRLECHSLEVSSDRTSCEDYSTKSGVTAIVCLSLLVAVTLLLLLLLLLYAVSLLL